MINAAKQIAELAAKRISLPLGQPSFRPKQYYRSQDFDSKNFKKINLSKQESHTRAYLDGGNLPLIQTPSFAVQFERVYVSAFKGQERTNLGIPSKLEFFVVVTSNDSGKYETEFISLNEDQNKFLPDKKDLVFDSYDETMSTGGQQIEIPRVGDVARSFAEWNYAKYVCEQLSDGDLFVRDGTLHAPYTNQTKYTEAAYETAKKNQVLFAGVSKTSHLYTTSGLPLVVAINRLARENKAEAPWYYENIVDSRDPSHKADINFAKLNGQSDYTFRIELLKGQEGHKENVMAMLAADSRDISFPGYPYGLVVADKNARVSYEELDSLKMMLFSEISKVSDFGDFKDFLAGSEAHEWLNRVV